MYLAGSDDLFGLSPRVRGNPGGQRLLCAGAGSIPARAGEPVPTWNASPTWQVYPRACGGTRMVLAQLDKDSGLSPRVRGNLEDGWHATFVNGSIPARAGEPRCAAAASAPSGVYPRACGGTVRADVQIFPVQGLSPRVRGNRATLRCRNLASGSIPARAGEPRIRRRAAGKGPVYPRACGGTTSVSDAATCKCGLSPRVRGTTPGSVAGNCCPGLSPRVRGNHSGRSASQFPIGSIPARAGEPIPNEGQGQRPAVYPRACGGTGVRRRIARVKSGLSPRVRGNRS